MAEIKIGDFSLLRTGEGRDFAQTRYRWRVKSISAAISYRGTHVKRAGAASGSRAFRTCSTSGVVQSLSLSLSFYLPFFFSTHSNRHVWGEKNKKNNRLPRSAPVENLYTKIGTVRGMIGKFVSCVFYRLGERGRRERESLFIFYS